MIYLNLSKAFSHIILDFTSLVLRKINSLWNSLTAHNCTTRLFAYRLWLVKKQKRNCSLISFDSKGSESFSIKYRIGEYMRLSAFIFNMMISLFIIMRLFWLCCFSVDSFFLFWFFFYRDETLSAFHISCWMFCL